VSTHGATHDFTRRGLDEPQSSLAEARWQAMQTAKRRAAEQGQPDATCLDAELPETVPLPAPAPAPAPAVVPDHPALTPGRRKLVEAARTIAARGDRVTHAAVAAECGITPGGVANPIAWLREAGLWPWEVSPQGRRPRPATPPEPPAASQEPTPAVETAPEPSPARPARHGPPEALSACACKPRATDTPCAVDPFDVARQVAGALRPLAPADRLRVLDLLRDLTS
jgi:hypothetical protein